MTMFDIPWLRQGAGLFAAVAVAVALTLGGVGRSDGLWLQQAALVMALWGLGRAFDRLPTMPRSKGAAGFVLVLSFWVLGAGGFLAAIATAAIAFVWAPVAVLLPLLFALSAHLGLSIFEMMVVSTIAMAPFVIWPDLQRRFALRGQGPDGMLSIHDFIEDKERDHG
ncbi:hypothetical protein [Pacificoceanicola onchidii]|uniref:hypothetical protein n=1 Tax=Pacificoceanicola onchidii TaxID=2562685 RepID=UPI0010A63B2B|nr:hypothetical protein [Pacificoceanicola onchidii]